MAYFPVMGVTPEMMMVPDGRALYSHGTYPSMMPTYNPQTAYPYTESRRYMDESYDLMYPDATYNQTQRIQSAFPYMGHKYGPLGPTLQAREPTPYYNAVSTWPVPGMMAVPESHAIPHFPQESIATWETLLRDYALRSGVDHKWRQEIEAGSWGSLGNVAQELQNLKTNVSSNRAVPKAQKRQTSEAAHKPQNNPTHVAFSTVVHEPQKAKMNDHIRKGVHEPQTITSTVSSSNLEHEPKSHKTNDYLRKPIHEPQVTSTSSSSNMEHEPQNSKSTGSLSNMAPEPQNSKSTGSLSNMAPEPQNSKSTGSLSNMAPEPQNSKSTGSLSNMAPEPQNSKSTGSLSNMALEPQNSKSTGSSSNMAPEPQNSKSTGSSSNMAPEPQISKSTGSSSNMAHEPQNSKSTGSSSNMAPEPQNNKSTGSLSNMAPEPQNSKSTGSSSKMAPEPQNSKSTGSSSNMAPEPQNSKTSDSCDSLSKVVNEPPMDRSNVSFNKVAHEPQNCATSQVNKSNRSAIIYSVKSLCEPSSTISNSTVYETHKIKSTVSSSNMDQAPLSRTIRDSPSRAILDHSNSTTSAITKRDVLESPSAIYHRAVTELYSSGPSNRWGVGTDGLHSCSPGVHSNMKFLEPTYSHFNASSKRYHEPSGIASTMGNKTYFNLSTNGVPGSVSTSGLFMEVFNVDKMEPIGRPSPKRRRTSIEMTDNYRMKTGPYLTLDTSLIGIEL